MRLFSAALHMKGWWHRDTAHWNILRKQHLNNLNILRKQAGSKELIWMHCASVGEFEQGLPVLKEIRAIKGDDAYVLVSFFSPSGYNQRKHTDHANAVIYLPLDTAYAARRLVKELKPAFFIGVKYEFWWQLLKALQHAGVPVMYLSVKLKESHYLGRAWAAGFRKILQNIRVIFTQDLETTQKLEALGFRNAITAGDTRVSAVLDRKTRVRSILPLEGSRHDKRRVMVYGSIYASDLPVMQDLLKSSEWLHVVVPHKVDEATLGGIRSALGVEHHVWSEWDGTWKHNVVLVDVLGWLFDIYDYGHACYIGGGFERSVHNTLEPAVFGLPLAFGPAHKGFAETEYFLEKGIATEVRTPRDLADFSAGVMELRTKIQEPIQAYFQHHSRALSRIVEWLQQQRI